MTFDFDLDQEERNEAKERSRADRLKEGFNVLNDEYTDPLTRNLDRMYSDREDPDLMTPRIYW